MPSSSPRGIDYVRPSKSQKLSGLRFAAFIGAGGFGERIATGLALNDNATLLAGAIPAALLALLTQGIFALAERRVDRAFARSN